MQTDWVCRRLRAAHPGLAIETVIIQTSGDRFTDGPLGAVGGKGLFVKEIEEALCAGSIDCAVHSLKDLPAELAPGLVLAAVPERADPRDVVVCRASGGLAALRHGARVGTSSLRRGALVRAARADLEVTICRGNVDTRLRKLERGEVDALVLAAAGLERLGATPAHAEPMDPRTFVPAIGQGALALESRSDGVAEIVRHIEDVGARQAIEAERAFLAGVGGDCFTPLAAHAVLDAGALLLRALIASPDGRTVVRGQRSGAPERGREIGTTLAGELLAQGGAEILVGVADRAGVSGARR